LNQRALAAVLLGGALLPLSATFQVPKALLPSAVLGVAPAHAATPLAPSLQGKPVLVEIYASWCPACQQVQPVLESVRDREGDAIHLVQFDVSTPASARRSAARADELGLGAFYRSHRSQTSLVGILDPGTGASVATFRAQTALSPYLTAIDKTRSLISR